MPVLLVPLTNVAEWAVFTTPDIVQELATLTDTLLLTVLSAEAWKLDENNTAPESKVMNTDIPAKLYMIWSRVLSSSRLNAFL